MPSIWSRVATFLTDCRGVAATEFAVVVPLMLAMFFATIEFSNGVAVDRKVTLVVRTLSDLTSRSTTVTDTDFTNFFGAGNGVMYPYASSLINATISELYVDPNTLVARVQWSKGAAVRATKSTVAIPAALQVAGSYLIFAEVNYTFTPTVAWFLTGGIKLSDVAYTRPRQSQCVMYNTTVCTTS